MYADFIMPIKNKIKYGETDLKNKKDDKFVCNKRQPDECLLVCIVNSAYIGKIKVMELY